MPTRVVTELIGKYSNRQADKVVKVRLFHQTAVRTILNGQIFCDAGCEPLAGSGEKINSKATICVWWDTSAQKSLWCDCKYQRSSNFVTNSSLICVKLTEAMW